MQEKLLDTKKLDIATVADPNSANFLQTVSAVLKAQTLIASVEQKLLQCQPFEIASVALKPAWGWVLGLVMKHGFDFREDSVAKLALVDLGEQLDSN